MPWVDVGHPRRARAALSAAPARRDQEDQGRLRGPGRAALAAAVLRPREAPPQGLRLQPHHDLGVPRRAGGRARRRRSWRRCSFRSAVARLRSRFEGDFILFAYLLGLGRFFTVAAALDTGSSFEGMGGAREVTFSCLAEPALFLALLVLARASGSLSLTGMLGPQLAAIWTTAGAALAAVVVSLFIVLLAENSPHPLRRSEHAPGADDDPRGHGARPRRAGARHDPRTAPRVKLFVFSARWWCGSRCRYGAERCVARLAGVRRRHALRGRGRRSASSSR